MSCTALPYELIRTIFELAASDSRHTIFRLLFISHDARNWLECQLYTKVQLWRKTDRDMFERCRIARDDDSFLKNAVQQLYIAPDPDLLSVCTNITHLSLQNYPGHDYPLPSLRHLQSLKYLAVGGIRDDLSADDLPPNLTHLHYRDSRIPLASPTIPLLATDSQFLSHLMLDFSDLDSEQDTNILPDILRRLSSRWSRIAIALPCTFLLEDASIDEIDALRQLHPPDLFVVDGWNTLRGVMQCDQSSFLRFDLWDEIA